MLVFFVSLVAAFFMFSFSLLSSWGPKTLCCTLFSLFFSRKRRKKLFFQHLSNTSVLFCGFSPSLPSLAAFSGELKTRERERETEKSEEEGAALFFSFLPPSSNKATLEERRLRLSVANFSSYLCPKSRQFPPPPPPLFFAVCPVSC